MDGPNARRDVGGGAVGVVEAFIPDQVGSQGGDGQARQGNGEDVLFHGFMGLMLRAGRQRFAVLDELLTLPLGLFFGLIPVRLTTTTSTAEIKRLVAKVLTFL